MNVEIVCVIDRSGSMKVVADDAIGGFNSFLASQKELGDARFTLVLFDHDYQTVHDGEELSQVPELDHKSYVPRGTTALYDAIGRTIDTVGDRFKYSGNKPDKVIFVILTDGRENSSTDYDRDRIARMIRHQQEKYSWEFLFLAANQDAFAEGRAMNIKRDNTVHYESSKEGTKSAYAAMEKMVSRHRK